MGQVIVSAAAKRAERRAMLALIAAFALLVQALFPNLAMAASTPLTGGAICAEHAVAPTIGGDAALGGHHCGDCLCAVPSLTVSGSGTASPICYPKPPELHRTIQPVRDPKARGPPRPLGQGPPVLNA